MVDSNLLKRLKLAETKLTATPVSLRMPDGSFRIISGTMKHWNAVNLAAFLRMGARLDGFPISQSALDSELDWLTECAEVATEPNGQLFGLVKALLDGAILACDPAKMEAYAAARDLAAEPVLFKSPLANQKLGSEVVQ